MFVKSVKRRVQGTDRRAEKLLRIYFFVLMDSTNSLATFFHEKVYEDFTRRLTQNSKNGAGSSYRPQAT
jgi:hypothetical protein